MTFHALVVRDAGEGHAQARVERLSHADLPPGGLEIAVEWSSLNFKDALACRGHRGVVARLPHVPGIDAAGAVVASDSPQFRPGDAVLVTGYDLGSGAWGGYSGCIRVPAQWALPMPEGLDARSAMVLGTAGFTAAQAVWALERHGVGPEAGPVCVTGATGGVGVWAVALLAKLGYQVTAVSGKAELHGALRDLGAAEVVDRTALEAPADRPLLSEKWAGAVDTVGGAPLGTLLRQTRHRGCVATCGMVAGAELPITVYPFILRGVTLAGIDSAKCPREPRLEVWRRLSGPWRIDLPPAWVTETNLDGLPGHVTQMLAGRLSGRTIVAPSSNS